MLTLIKLHTKFNLFQLSKENFFVRISRTSRLQSFCRGKGPPGKEITIEEGLGRVWNDDDGTFTILNEVT